VDNASEEPADGGKDELNGGVSIAGLVGAGKAGHLNNGPKEGEEV